MSLTDGKINTFFIQEGQEIVFEKGLAEAEVLMQPLYLRKSKKKAQRLKCTQSINLKSSYSKDIYPFHFCATLMYF